MEKGLMTTLDSIKDTFDEELRSWKSDLEVCIIIFVNNIIKLLYASV